MSEPLPLSGAQPLHVPAPASAELELWMARLSAIEEGRLDAAGLDELERTQAARLQRASDRVGYIAAHLLLRQLLGRRLGLPAAGLTFRREPCPACGGPHGRPALETPVTGPRFSLSRSGDLVIAALAATPVGVDVEELPAPETVQEVSGLLHPAELAEVEAAAAAARPVTFARLWTRKEAYLKGLGVGIATGLAAEDLSHETVPEGWSVVEVPVPTGYAAAVACRVDPHPPPGEADRSSPSARG